MEANIYGCSKKNPLTSSNEAKSTENQSDVKKWIEIGISAITTITSVIALCHRIKRNHQQDEDTKKREQDRKQEKLEDRTYQEQQKQKDREYQEAQRKENRAYNHQEWERRQEHYEKQRDEERRANAEEREKTRQFKLTRMQLRLNSSIPPIPAQSQSMADFCQQEIPLVDELRLVGNVIHSGERGVIFGGTGQCKSFLVWQIGIDLALGQSSRIFPTEPSMNKPMPVHILDGEMSDVDISNRYPHELLERLSNLHRVTKIPTGVESLIEEVNKIACDTHETECVIIIDNLNSLCHNATSKQIGKLYNALKVIGEQANEKGTRITMIVVVHERKHNDGKYLRLMNTDDIYGSSFFGDFAEFIIGIAPTKAEDVKRIRVVKSRKIAKKQGVILARLVDKPYMSFDYLQEISEEEAIAKEAEDFHPTNLQTGDITVEVAKQMNVLHKHGVKGCGWDAVGRQFGVSGTAVKKALKRYKLL